VSMKHCAVFDAGASDPVVQQTLYVLTGLTLLMLVVLVVAWRVLRLRGRRKMALLVTKQHILKSHSHDIDLKVTPIGDSTLKVTFTLSVKLYLLVITCYMRTCDRIFCKNLHIAYFSAYNCIFEIT